MTSEEAVLKIKEIIADVAPRCAGEYSLSYIKDMVENLIEMHKGLTEKNILRLSYPESIRVDILNNVTEQMKGQLLERREGFLWQDDNPKDEYERGVLHAIRLIQHRIHCICDD